MVHQNADRKQNIFFLDSKHLFFTKLAKINIQKTAFYRQKTAFYR
jgi:hypothetical protein